jgi:hypothetical protein
MVENLEAYRSGEVLVRHDGMTPAMAQVGSDLTDFVPALVKLAITVCWICSPRGEQNLCTLLWSFDRF